jgi:hypothetical protein
VKPAGSAGKETSAIPDVASFVDASVESTLNEPAFVPLGL